MAKIFEPRVWFCAACQCLVHDRVVAYGEGDTYTHGEASHPVTPLTDRIARDFLHFQPIARFGPAHWAALVSLLNEVITDAPLRAQFAADFNVIYPTLGFTLTVDADGALYMEVKA